MVKLIMHGCNGHMGQVISDLVKQDPDAEIVAGIDIVDNRDNGYPVFTNIWDCHVEADALIDFASAKAMDNLLDYCVDRKLPAVLCTTGLSTEQLDRDPRGQQKSGRIKIRQHVSWHQYTHESVKGCGKGACPGRL